MQNFGVSGPSRKPLVIGEMGGFKSAYDTADRAAAALAAWQAASCPYGVQGWLIWTWDTDEQPELWNALSSGAAIAKRPLPARRPDPCAPPGLATSRSGSPSPHPTKASTRPPTRSTATPGLSGALAGMRRSGSRSTLGAPETVARIRLTVAQYRTGRPTTGCSSAAEPRRPYVLVGEPGGPTHDGQVIDLVGTAPWQNVRFVRVETVSSPSWVSWREIEALAP